MTTQYNVVTYGTLTNTNGVLSGFSASNYATIPLTFNPVQHPYEIVFKINTGTIQSSTSGIIWQTGDASSVRGRLDLEVFGGKLYVEFVSNGGIIWTITGITTLSSDTDYWIKLTYNGVNTYGLYISTDGTTWTTEGTITSIRFLGDGSGKYNIIGVQPDNGGMLYPWFGSIDLNESYININNIRWWQGATSTSNVQTKIQLRHDTAANWTSVNPTLLQGEVGLETDTGKSKVGDGSTAWNSLAYDLASTALQSHQSLANYVDLSSAQSITGLKTFDSIKTNTIYDPSNRTILYEYSGNVTVGNNATTLTLRGTGTRPQYKVGTNTANDIALTSDIPTVPTNISSFTNDSGYITGITSSNVTTALGYTPVDTNLSNLSSTGTKVLDGQWVAVSTQIANEGSVNGSTNLTYTLSDVPNDGNKYEVLLVGQVYTSNTSGNQARIQVSSDIVSGVYICAAVTRASQSAIAMGSVVIPVGNRQITVARDTGWNGTFNLYIKGYRRIGSNS